MTLPLFLDLPELRVVHACWHQPFIDYLASYLTSDAQLTEALIVAATREPEVESDKDTPEPTLFKAVEALLKGIEIPLPAPHNFTDKDGHVRNRVRVRWWDGEALAYRDVAMLDDVERRHLPSDSVPDHVRIGYDGNKPVFVGHYWQKGDPILLSDNVACVDYSVAKMGKLVAYRYEGESVLLPNRFQWVDA
jgi:hypothetical protein